MLNIENIDKLIAHFEHLKEIHAEKLFDMDFYMTDMKYANRISDGTIVPEPMWPCKTVACIAGHATIIQHGIKTEDEYRDLCTLVSVRITGAKFLGIDDEWARHLFLPPLNYGVVTVDHAINALQILRVLGDGYILHDWMDLYPDTNLQIP